jgi:hypothetical protein
MTQSTRGLKAYWPDVLDSNGAVRIKRRCEDPAPFVCAHDKVPLLIAAPGGLVLSGRQHATFCKPIYPTCMVKHYRTKQIGAPIPARTLIYLLRPTCCRQQIENSCLHLRPRRYASSFVHMARPFDVQVTNYFPFNWQHLAQLQKPVPWMSFYLLSTQCLGTNPARSQIEGFPQWYIVYQKQSYRSR